jgi:UDP-N-acetylglucosamine 2-epimerase (non-hydrolysing)
MRILSVVSDGPNFLRLAPVERALAKRGDVEHVIVHSGQRHAPELSNDLFEHAWIPAPDYHLGVGSGSHAQQTAAAMQRLEPILVELRPELVLVYGDDNCTLAAALVAAKLGERVAHIEAGLRSGDWTMPDEVNRVVIDRLSDLLFVPSRDAAANLAAEGFPDGRLHFVGNPMIDSLCWALPQALELDAAARRRVAGEPYAVVRLEHASNVDDPAALRELLDALERLGSKMAVLFATDRRTRARIDAVRVRPPSDGGLRLLDPPGYLEMLGLVAQAHLVVTDSGSLQEATTFLGVPCITVRSSTERAITCTHGTNRLVAPRRDVILAAAERAVARRSPARPLIERWDGRAAERIVAVMCDEAWCDAEPGVAPIPGGPRPARAMPQPVGVA